MKIEKHDLSESHFNLQMTIYLCTNIGKLLINLNIKGLKI